ncbi:sulfatase-like hydrolase/transferase [bacterium]|nr:sulfatase-like hydrolase/transferase [bacterium]
MRKSGKAAVYGLILAALTAAPTCSRAPRLNVLLVSFDTTRADRLGCYGDSAARTPVLDSLAANGVRFARAYTAVPITLPTHATVLTGLYPPSHGVRNNGTFRLSAAVPTLAESFRAAGYATAAFTGSFVLDHRYGLDRGFDLYDDDMYHGGGRATGMMAQRERRADIVAARAGQWLKKNSGRPFFLFVHFFDPHRPWEAPEPFAAAAADPYRAEIAWTDHCLGGLLAALDSLGLARNTLMLMFGDHGEGLGEHGEQTHSTFLYNSTVHVPLILSLPGVDSLRAQVMDTPVSLADVAPTLAALAGVEPPGGCQGQALASAQGLIQPPANRPLYLECWYPWYCHGWSPLEGVVRGGRKYVRAPRPELYNLDTDPAELANLVPGPPADSLARVLENLKHALTPREAATRPAAAPGAEESAGLRALGYVAGRSAAPDEDISRLPDPKDMIVSVPGYMLGVSYLTDSHPELAAREFRALLAADPANWSAWEFLAESELALGHPDSALAAAQQAVRSQSPSERAFFLLGSAALELADSARAQKELERALTLNPDYGPALALLARIHDSAGRTEQALEFYHRAEAALPGNPGLLTDLGALLIRLGDYARARATLERATALEGAGWRAWFNLGLACQLDSDNEAAVQAYERATVLEGVPAEAFNNLGIACYELKRYEQSCRAYERAIGLDSLYAAAWNNLGGSRAALGQNKEAEAAYWRALALKPDYPDAALNYGLLLAGSLERPDSARVLLRRALRGLAPGPRRESAAALLERLEKTSTR